MASTTRRAELHPAYRPHGDGLTFTPTLGGASVVRAAARQLQPLHLSQAAHRYNGIPAGRDKKTFINENDPLADVNGEVFVTGSGNVIVRQPRRESEFHLTPPPRQGQRFGITTAGQLPHISIYIQRWGSVSASTEKLISRLTLKATIPGVRTQRPPPTPRKWYGND